MSTNVSPPWADVSCPDCGARFPIGDDPTFRHDDACPVSVAVEEILTTDREWFADHPGTTYYWRDLLPADLGISTLACIGSVDERPLRVKVTQLGPGVRSKRLPTEQMFVLIASAESGPSLDALVVARLLYGAAEMPGSWMDRVVKAGRP